MTSSFSDAAGAVAVAGPLVASVSSIDNLHQKHHHHQQHRQQRHGTWPFVVHRSGTQNVLTQVFDIKLLNNRYCRIIASGK